MSETDEKNNQPPEPEAPDTETPEPEASAPVADAPVTGVTDADTSATQNSILQATQGDVFDYVIPPARRRKKRKHHKKGKSKGKSGGSSSEPAEDGSDVEYILVSHRRRSSHKHKHKHRHHHRHKHRRRGARGRRKRKTWKQLPRWKRALIMIPIVLLALIVVLTGAVFIMSEIGRNSLKPGDVSISVPSQDESGNDVVLVDKSGRVITYDGVTYELNEDLITVPFIGVDEGVGNDNEKLEMADAIYIFTFDTKAGKSKILSISRDTMTDVDRYTEDGEFIDARRMQISFSYAFGNKKVPGGKNTDASLSRLFYGLPFKDYFAINMNALITLNDAIGGVTLTSSVTFVSPEDGRTIKEGETVTLHGKEADYYVRHRDTEKLDSNNARMQRQQEYIRAFLGSILPAVRKDLSVISKLNRAIGDNSETTLTAAKIVYIGSSAALKIGQETDIEYLSLKGTITAGQYAELNVTNKDTIRTMLDVFYKPLATVPEGIKPKELKAE